MTAPRTTVAPTARPATMLPLPNALGSTPAKTLPPPGAPGWTLKKRLSHPDAPEGPPEKMRRLYTHQQTRATLQGHIALYSMTRSNAAVEKQRVAEAVSEWVASQRQFKGVRPFFHSEGVAFNIVDNILAFYGHGGTHPIMAVNACRSQHHPTCLTIIEEMQPQPLAPAPKTITEIVFAEFQESFELDTCAERPMVLDVRACLPPQVSAYNTIRGVPPSVETTPFTRAPILLHAQQDPFDFQTNSKTSSTGFDAFYGGKDVAMPDLPVSKDFMYATLAQSFNVPKLLTMAIAIESARHLVLGTVVVLKTTATVEAAALELHNLFCQRVAITTVLLGPGPHTNTTALKQQRVDVRATLEQLGVVLCVREKSAIRELMDTLAEIKNDKTSILGRMMMYREERSLDSVRYNIMKSAIKLVKERQDINIISTKSMGAQRLAYMNTVRDAKTVPLTDELRLANKKKANEEICQYPGRHFTVNSLNQ
ncbi:hypothetical protein T484DRAFT_1758155, partial [Baffinella frigidus]